MCKGVGDTLTLCRHCLGGVELGFSNTFAFHAILFDNTSANQAPWDDYHHGTIMMFFLPCSHKGHQ